jgi:hypothetical protein
LMNKKDKVEELTVIEMAQGRLQVRIIGRSPILLNRPSVKVVHELLLPRRKTRADKDSTLKHNPPEEYRASAYTAVGNGNDVPTRLLLLATSFKSAMREVAVDIPGANKAAIGRLTYVNGTYISLYGIPKLHMCIARLRDIARTPDVRTRAIVPEWACQLTVTYTKPNLREQAVLNLLAAAGTMRGVGDWRPEKGSGSFGQFELVSDETDASWKAILKAGGRAAQDKALAQPECYDSETADLLAWFNDEAGRRGFKVVA